MEDFDAVAGEDRFFQRGILPVFRAGCGFQVGELARLFPARPVDGDHGIPPLCPREMCERVEECVRAAVVGFREWRGDCGDGGAQDEEIQIRIRQQAVENPSTGDFRSHDTFRKRASFCLNHSSPDDSCRVDDAVDGLESFAGGREDGAHCFRVGCVGGHHVDFRTEAFDFDQLPERPRHFVRRVRVCEEILPLRLFGKGIFLRQHEPRAAGPGEMLRHGQPDAAGAAGDQIHAAVAQPIRARRRGRQSHGDELPPPAMRAAVGEYFTRGRLRKFGQNPTAMTFTHAVRFLRTDEVNVETRDVGKLFRNHPARSEHRGHRGIQRLVAGDLMNPARNHSHRDRRGDGHVADCTGDFHEAEETQVLREFARGRIAGAVETPEVENVEGGPSRIFDFAKKLEIIFAPARIDLDRSIGRALEGLAESDEFCRGTGLRQQFREAVEIFAAIRKDEPKNAVVLRVARVVGDGSGSFPRRHMEPAIHFERCGFRDDGSRFVGSRNVAGIEPINAPLKGIRRERDAASRWLGVQRIPADFQTSQPESSGGGEKNFRVRLVFVVMAQAGDRQR